MSTHENSIIRHRASPRPIGMALESLSSVSSFSLEEKKKKEEKRKLVFREWKEATTVRFFDQDLFDPRTSEADSCLWYPSNDDFVKNSKRCDGRGVSAGKVIQSCSVTGLGQADGRTLTT